MATLKVVLLFFILISELVCCSYNIMGDLQEFYANENLKYGKETVNDHNKGCKPRSDFQYGSKDIERIINVLSKMVSYFEKYKDDIIADGLYGLRSAQGILQGLEGAHFGSHETSIKHLTKYITQLSEIIYKRIVHRRDSYDKGFLQVVKKPQSELDLPWRTLQSLEKYIWKDSKSKHHFRFSEKESDHCYQLLFGSAPNSNGRKCVISDKCKTTVTKPKTRGYMLTHQFLYFHLGIGNGCRRQLEEHFGGKAGLKNLFDLFAANIGKQATTDRDIDTQGDLDIQIEQFMVCTMLKVVECNSKQFFEKIFKAIDGNGCVIDPEEQDGVIEKRIDKEIGGCSQHANTLAVAYFASTLKFIFKQPSCELLQ